MRNTLFLGSLCAGWAVLAIACDGSGAGASRENDAQIPSKNSPDAGPRLQAEAGVDDTDAGLGEADSGEEGGVAPSCEPKRCREGFECGVAADGCGGMVDCGRCGTGTSCLDHACVSACDGCIIDGACIAEGQSDPRSSCRRCDVGASRDAWTSISGVDCDDGNACTEVDQCQQGLCVGVAKLCDDGVACNGSESCDAASGACKPGISTCAGGFCDLVEDACVPRCDGCKLGGVCYQQSAIHPSNPCLACDTTGTFVPTPGRSCGEEGICRQSTRCNAEAVCEITYTPKGVVCGAITACTTTTCDGAGYCVRENAESGTPCSDPAVCDSPDTCDDEGECVDRGPLAASVTCAGHGHCNGLAAAPACSCDDGYGMQGDLCIDVDECAANLDTCDAAPSACIDQEGSYACECPAGFVGDGKGPHGCTCERDDASPVCKPWTLVAHQYYHGCAISDGALFCWGFNERGQLGVGDNIDRVAPTRVGDARDWSAVSVGYDSSCGLRQGAMYCWGENSIGRLGHGGSGLLPERVGTASDWTAVSMSQATTCGLRGDGELYCWGYNGSGQVGIADDAAIFVKTPTRVLPVTGFDRVSLGMDTVCAIRDGSLFCWGSNHAGQVGDGTRTQRNSPVHVTGFDDWVDVDPGYATCAVRANGELWCWGTGFSPTPARVEEIDAVQRVSTGGSHRCVQRAGGEVWCWGFNGDGRLGDGTATAQLEPYAPLAPRFEQIVASFNTTCGLNEGRLLCWGSNEYGARGTGNVIGRVGSAADFTQVSAGLTQSCGIRGAGELWCWGEQPAVEPTIQSPIPTPVDSNSDWLRVSVGWQFSCGIRAPGALYCWGYAGSKGRLGVGDDVDRPRPARVGNADDWTDISAGYDSACAVRANGDVYCWGNGRKTPTLLGSLGYGAVAVGNTHSLATRSGQLYVLSDPPMAEGTLSTWARIDVGYDHQCGIAGGQLYCWGSNSFGQLGDGGAGYTLRNPTRIGTEDGWTDADVGSSASCAIQEGKLRCWGSNSYGQLGTPDVTRRLLPTEVPGDGYSRVSMSNGHTCAIRGGAVYCWGSNASGQLGHTEGMVPTLVRNDNDLR